MIIQPVLEGNYFHIYNRGINSEDLFKEEKNYSFFLEQYKKYCTDVFDTYSYALLKNHFHLFVYVKENVVVKRNDGKGEIKLTASKQLAHFFNSYAQAINKSHSRTGSLFESPFERKLVNSEHYISSMIYYCHYNAQLHGMVKDFKDWPFSSYHSIMEGNTEIIATEKVLQWFGGKEAFEKQHQNRYNPKDLTLLLERENI